MYRVYLRNSIDTYNEAMSNQKTLFEKIVDREIPAEIVFEDDDTIAFLDIDPVNLGHTLVVPKAPYPNLYETPDEVLEKLIVTTKRLAVAIKEAVKADGINIGQNNELAAGQEVFHLHFHIMPRHKGDDFSHWQGKRDYQEGEMQKYGEKIRKEL